MSTDDVDWDVKGRICWHLMANKAACFAKLSLAVLDAVRQLLLAPLGNRRNNMQTSADVQQDLAAMSLDHRLLEHICACWHTFCSSDLYA